MSFGPLQTTLRFWARIGLTLCWLLVTLPFIYTSFRLKLPFHPFLIRLFSHGMNWIFGVKVVLKGAPVEKKRPVLFVCNHTSYLDIYALAAHLRGVFIAKDDIAGWPGVGWLTTLSGVIFISRNPQKTLENIERVKQSPSRAFVLFPEGTTSDGNRVKKFNSAFFSLVHQLSGALKEPMVVQPVSLAYTRIANIPMGNHYRPYFSWFGDMELAPHAKKALGFSSVAVEITLHPVIEGEDLKDRKKLAQICEQKIAGSMAESLTLPKKSKAKHILPPRIAA